MESLSSNLHLVGAAGGGEKTVGKDPLQGMATGERKRANTGEWSVPNGPGVFPIPMEERKSPTPPAAISRARLLAYTAPIRDLRPLELDHV